MNQWLAARVRAYKLRKDIEHKIQRELYGQDLIDAIIEDDATLTCLECAEDDPLLGNAEDGFDQARYYAESGFIVVSNGLPDQETKAFYAAHELGHRYVHTRPATCRTDDVDPTNLVLTLPYAEGRIATYHPRQIQESEASIFAAELLVPSHRLARHFDDGQNASTLAAEFGVPRYVILSQMTAVLLAPLPDFEKLLTETEQIPFHWEKLDDSQKRACCIFEGPVLVQAGPGTGKTRTLTSRIEWLISEKNVAPERILALTFSNKATEELRSRLRQTVPDHAHQVTVSTFHGFGLELIRRFADSVGLPADVRVIDPAEAEFLLEENLTRLDLVHFSDPAIPNRYLADILAEIARAKDALVTPNDYLTLVSEMERKTSSEDDHEKVAKCQEVARVYHEYNQLLQENGLVDYGDLVMQPIQIFESDPDLLLQLQHQYEHILVDEYQDINRANGKLVRLLAGEGGAGLWAVGDLRQSIYRFRGASPTYIRLFNEHYPQAKIVPLEINYRAFKKLVDFAKGVASQMNIQLANPHWHSFKGALPDSSISTVTAEDKQSELKGIGGKIQEFVKAGTAYSDIAVLCRTNTQASEITTVLSQLGVPTMHLGKFFFRREVKDLLSILSLIVDKDGSTWPRVANFLKTPIPVQQALIMRKEAREKGQKIPWTFSRDEISLLSQSQQEDLDHLVKSLQQYTLVNNANPWLVLADFLFEYGYYLQKLRSEKGVRTTQALIAIGQLLNLARAFRQRATIGSEKNATKAFIHHVRRLIERDDNDVDLPVSEAEVNAVRVLTIHKSKGLEFPVIFVPHLAKGYFPARGGYSSVPRVEGLESDPEPDGDALDEERCLFVAITRAEQHLILSRAQSYYRRKGKPVRSNRSELWRLLDKPLVEMTGDIVKESWHETLDMNKQATLWQELPSGFLVDDGLELELRALRVYQRCPRQFFYRYILGLAVPDEHEIYFRFHKVIYFVLDWMQQTATGADAPDWNSVMVKLDEEFVRQIPDEYVHAKWYRQEAEAKLQALWQKMKETRRASVSSKYRELAIVEVQGLSLKLHLDEVADYADKRVVTRYRTGQESQKHATDPQLALYRKAAKQDTRLPVEVNLNYLATGDIRVIPDDKDEKLLVDLGEDITNLRSGSFPPEPSDKRYHLICANCSYLFLCPKGEEQHFENAG